MFDRLIHGDLMMLYSLMGIAQHWFGNGLVSPDTKPLPELMLIYGKLDPEEQTSKHHDMEILSALMAIWKGNLL